MVFWRPWEEFAVGVKFGQKRPQVFVVGRFVCGASRRGRLGGLGRWRLGECPGKVWDRLEVCGGGNFRRGGVGFRLGLRQIPAKCRAGFSAGRKGEVAGGSSEIRGWILGCSGGVLDAGSLEEGEAEVRRFWVDFRGVLDALSLGAASGKPLPSFWDQNPPLLLSFPPEKHSESPSLSA